MLLKVNIGGGLSEHAGRSQTVNHNTARTFFRQYRNFSEIHYPKTTNAGSDCGRRALPEFHEFAYL